VQAFFPGPIPPDCPLESLRLRFFEFVTVFFFVSVLTVVRKNVGFLTTRHFFPSIVFLQHFCALLSRFFFFCPPFGRGHVSYEKDIILKISSPSSVLERAAYSIASFLGGGCGGRRFELV